MDTRNWFSPLPKKSQRRFLKSQRKQLWIEIDQKTLLNFSSNDYLGLSQHPELCQAAISSINAEGLGSGASRLVSGDHPVFHAFEQQLAHWKGYEDALLVGSGMLANIGLLQALANRHTSLFCDKLNHASLVDGARLSQAKVYRYAHNDLVQLERLLQQHDAERRIIVSDGVFSMDGDAADTDALMVLAEEYQCLLIVDDAHGLGVMGSQGKGLLAEKSGHDYLIEVGTLGKSFGSYGAFILGSQAMIEGLRQRQRTMIYSTALPACLIQAASVALERMQQGERVEKLQHNIHFFVKHAQHLELLPSKSAIQALVLGSEERALSASDQLAKEGFFVPAIRPPTVPINRSRLRITISALHEEKDILRLIQALSHL
ncbi:MAG: 8-amino-7-oxononanoate synthase [Mariprofundaceae bacterium]|nr:8-amino-7-oxononanoate synthase [Mariprofundaceae bacterium]